MAVRPYWKGYLKLSLVTCAVTLSPATTDGEKVRFHTLNRKTGDRINTQYVDAVSGRAVDSDHQVKAYAKGEDENVILEDDELDAVKLDSIRTIDVNEFVEADTVEWVYYDSPYFVVPADEVGEEAFTVIREAMTKNNVVGISRLVLGNRERAVMLQPWDKGIILWTLRFGDEVRNEDEYWKSVTDDKPDAKMLGMVGKIIEDRTTPWSESMVKDPVQGKLLEIIKSKQSKKKPTAKKTSDGDAPDAPSNVIDLMAALKRSLAGRPAAKKSGR
ncbi:MAG: Ku protein [Hyphomicrobiales bacterium]|nr:MAG: Ku protein [Hyphomicrobiales bacterium]